MTCYVSSKFAIAHEWDAFIVHVCVCVCFSDFSCYHSEINFVVQSFLVAKL